MRRLGGRLIVALALICAALPALAQIPRSDAPGRERQRFQDPPTPRAQPRGASIGLPSTVAPPGADNITLVVRAVAVEGATVYGAAEFAPLYQDISLARRSR
jgi:hypothetical protein